MELWKPLIIVHALAPSYSVLLRLAQLVRRTKTGLTVRWDTSGPGGCCSSVVVRILNAGQFSPLHVLAAEGRTSPLRIPRSINIEPH